MPSSRRGLRLAQELAYSSRSSLSKGHGGQLTIDSHTETERRGTRVRVFLPAQNQYDASGSGGSSLAAEV
jgi:hypothetical protein